jgi:hypothetical protein
MLIKIDREECLNKYPAFPQRSYNYEQDEVVYFNPEVHQSFILTFASGSFDEHSKKLGTELCKLTNKLGYDGLIFFGDTEVAWLHQDNDYKPAKEAQQYLIGNRIGKQFNGAIQVDNSELLTFIKHLCWLTRCNASLPYIYFSDKEQNFIGSICQHGNVHIDTLNEDADRFLKLFIDNSGFKYLDGNNCYNQFEETGAIPGRRIIL